MNEAAKTARNNPNTQAAETNAIREKEEAKAAKTAAEATRTIKQKKLRKQQCTKISLMEVLKQKEKS